MKEKLKEKSSWAQALLSSTKEQDWEAACKDLSRWISYFQHERLIHLLVTALFAILTVLTLGALLLAPGFPILLLFCLLLALTIPYIFHYYRLENGTQALYNAMDQMEKYRRNAKKPTL